MKLNIPGALLSLLAFGATPAIATPSPTVETTCIWSPDKGELLEQGCKIYANSSAGAGSSIYLTWDDGLETVIRSRPGSDVYRTPESGLLAETHGTFVIGRTGLPRQIHIDGLGIIVITYRNYRVVR